MQQNSHKPMLDHVDVDKSYDHKMNVYCIIKLTLTAQ